MTRYVVRLDDACPTMDRHKWGAIESILDRYTIKPLVGVIPHNEDPNLNICTPDPHFWEKVRSWKNKEWTIALHGYNHVYCSTCSGINPIWNRSEFAGLSLEEQKCKIRKGIYILSSQNINPNVFFAPSHTYDLNTLKALLEESNIRIISDTIAINPYIENEMIYVPVQFGRFRKIITPGVYTFCFHPNSMSENDINDFEKFINENYKHFISFESACANVNNPKSILDKLLSKMYFVLRKLRNF